MKENFTYDQLTCPTATALVGLSHRGCRVETHVAAAMRHPYSGPLGIFAVVEKQNGEEAIHYILKDHLGSWTTITDSEGNVEQELSFDAWGNLRDPDAWTGAPTETPLFDRGYTGHEHLYAFGLINMNGRMYDPLMSSFLSVDRYVQSPENSQNFNRYAYCLNNPLKYTDPSGWVMQGALMGNPSQGVVDYTSVFMEPVHGISDFNNAYYKTNMAIYGNMEGPCGRGLYASGGMGSAAACQAAMDYYSSASPGMVWSFSHLINNYVNNPSVFNRRELLDAGVTDYTYKTWWTAEGQGGYRYSLTLNHGTYNYGSDNYYYGYKGFSDVTIGGMDLSNKPSCSNLLCALSFMNSITSTILGNNVAYYNSPTRIKELGSRLKPTLKKYGHSLKRASTMTIGKKTASFMQHTNTALGLVGVLYTGIDVAYNNDGVINPSHFLDAGVGITCCVVSGPTGWILGASYITIDVLSYAFSGQSFGYNLNKWCGGVGFDTRTFSIVH